MDYDIDEDIGIKIQDVKGRDDRYDNWSVFGQGWVEDENGRRRFVKNVRYNVSKGKKAFSTKDDDGVPVIAHELKRTYIDALRDDPEFNSYKDQEVVDEENELSSIEGEKFEF